MFKIHQPSYEETHCNGKLDIHSSQDYVFPKIQQNLKTKEGQKNRLTRGWGGVFFIRVDAPTSSSSWSCCINKFCTNELSAFLPLLAGVEPLPLPLVAACLRPLWIGGRHWQPLTIIFIITQCIGATQCHPSFASVINPLKNILALYRKSMAKLELILVK
jgi:hypothetical protein